MNPQELLDDLSLPEFFGVVFLGNAVLSWLVFALTLLIVVGVLMLLKRVLVARLTRLTERTRSKADDFVIRLLGDSRFFLLLFIALSLAVRTLTLPARVVDLAAKLGLIALFAQVGLWGTSAIAFFVARFAAAREMAEADTAMTIRAAGVLARIVLWTMVLLVTLQNVFEIDITALITGLGIGGVAIALAVQNILGDLFGAVSIVLDKPFVVGDFIIVDNYMGTVEYVGLKTTRIRSLSGEQIVFSNGDLLRSRIRNYKRMFERRIAFTVGVTYDTPHATLAAIPGWLRAIVEAQPEARLDRSHFLGFGDSSINFETVYFVRKPDYNLYMDVQQAINLDIVRKFGDEGVEFAFPTRTLHLSGRLESVPSRTTSDGS